MGPELCPTNYVGSFIILSALLREFNWCQGHPGSSLYRRRDRKSRGTRAWQVCLFVVPAIPGQASPRTSTQVSRCICSEKHSPDLPSIGPCGPSLVQSSCSSHCECPNMPVLGHEGVWNITKTQKWLGVRGHVGGITGSAKIPSQGDKGHKIRCHSPEVFLLELANS